MTAPLFRTITKYDLDFHEKIRACKTEVWFGVDNPTILMFPDAKYQKLGLAYPPWLVAMALMETAGRVTRALDMGKTEYEIWAHGGEESAKVSPKLGAVSITVKTEPERHETLTRKSKGKWQGRSVDIPFHPGHTFRIDLTKTDMLLGQASPSSGWVATQEDPLAQKGDKEREAEAHVCRSVAMEVIAEWRGWWLKQRHPEMFDMMTAMDAAVKSGEVQAKADKIL